MIGPFLDLLKSPLDRWLKRREDERAEQDELMAAREGVLERLHGLRHAEGKIWDDEKDHLGGDLDRLGEAISKAKVGPEWRAAQRRARGSVLLGGDRGAIDDCIRELETLG